MGLMKRGLFGWVLALALVACAEESAPVAPPDDVGVTVDVVDAGAEIAECDVTVDVPEGLSYP